MNRQQKEAIVANFRDLFIQSQAAFLVNYKGLSVKDMQSLRSTLRTGGAQLKVTKARMMKIAVEGIDGIDDFNKNLKGQVGLVFVKDEAVPAVAKQLVTFAKKNESLEIDSGFFESKVLSKERIEFLAFLPSKEVLLAQVVGLMQSPIVNFVRVLNMIVIRLLLVLKQVAEKKEAE